MEIRHITLCHPQSTVTVTQLDCSAESQSGPAIDMAVREGHYYVEVQQNCTSSYSRKVVLLGACMPCGLL
jgi:hypothetical protein